jgi:hypothetical protein
VLFAVRSAPRRASSLTVAVWPFNAALWSTVSSYWVGSAHKSVHVRMKAKPAGATSKQAHIVGVVAVDLRPGRDEAADLRRLARARSGPQLRTIVTT